MTASEEAIYDALFAPLRDDAAPSEEFTAQLLEQLREELVAPPGKIEMVERVPVARPPGPRRRWLYAVAAALLAIVIGVVIVGRSGPDQRKILVQQAPSATSGALQTTTTIVSFPTADYSFRHGKATVTVGAKTYELDTLWIGNPHHEFEAARFDRQFVVQWDRRTPPQGSFILALEGRALPTVGKLWFLGYPDDEAGNGANGANGCTVTFSESDLTAIRGTFDCPNLNPPASGSFSATP